MFSVAQDGPYTDMGWRIEADSLRELLVNVHETYPNLPLVITENGSAWDDVVDSDGAVHDPDRVSYLNGHLGAVHDAITAGVDIRGYYAWSLLDNFEWAYGYAKRFGIVYVDYDTQVRTIKDSGRRYSRDHRGERPARLSSRRSVELEHRRVDDRQRLSPRNRLGPVHLHGHGRAAPRAARGHGDERYRSGRGNGRR